MTDQEFYELVKQMRENQKKYFKNRDLQSLDESKKLERKIDAEIRARESEKKETKQEEWDRLHQLSLDL